MLGSIGLWGRMQSLRSSVRKVRKSFQFLFFLEEGTKVELFPGKYQKTFETDILKLRADELNFTLCMFVKVGPGRHLCHQSLNILQFEFPGSKEAQWWSVCSGFHLLLGAWDPGVSIWGEHLLWSSPNPPECHAWARYEIFKKKLIEHVDFGLISYKCELIRMGALTTFSRTPTTIPSHRHCTKLSRTSSSL